MFLYILRHSYSFEEGNKYGVRPGYEEVKLLGVYSSRELAEEAAERYFQYEGFEEYPRSSFTVDKYEVGKDEKWTGGFVKENDIAPPDHEEGGSRGDIFILFHEYEYGEDYWYEEVKTLGLYETIGAAKEAIERYCVLEGFKDCPKECFAVEGYFIDRDTNWVGGFFKAEEECDDENQ